MATLKDLEELEKRLEKWKEDCIVAHDDCANTAFFPNKNRVVFANVMRTRMDIAGVFSRRTVIRTTGVR